MHPSPTRDGPRSTVRSNNGSCPVWPHGFVAVDIDPEQLIQNYDSNHVHGIYGDHVAELVKFCELKQIQCEVLG